MWKGCMPLQLDENNPKILIISVHNLAIKTELNPLQPKHQTVKLQNNVNLPACLDSKKAIKSILLNNASKTLKT